MFVSASSPPLSTKPLIQRQDERVHFRAVKDILKLENQTGWAVTEHEFNTDAVMVRALS